MMTLLNVKINQKKKERIKELIKNSEYKSLSDLVRKAIDEKIKILENKKQNSKIIVPDFIPDGKYYAIVRGAIVGVGDNISSLAKEIVSKFPNDEVIIDRKNKEIPKLEYAYSAYPTEMNCKPYFKIRDISSYPIISVNLVKNNKKVTFNAIPDTAASLTLIKNEIVDKFELKQVDIQQFQTASGISNAPIYEINLEIFNRTIPTRIVSAPISDILPFEGLIGRNVLDFFDLYLFGKDQIICMK